MITKLQQLNADVFVDIASAYSDKRYSLRNHTKSAVFFDARCMLA